MGCASARSLVSLALPAPADVLIQEMNAAAKAHHKAMVTLGPDRTPVT